MRISLPDPDLCGELASFLRACGCDAVESEFGVEVATSRWATASAARCDLGLYADVWRLLHPDAPAALDD